MTIQRFLAVLRRRAIIVCSVFAIGLALLYTFRNAVPNSYAGVSHVVLVAESGARDPSVGIVDLPSIATSTVVLERVRNSLHLPMSLINLKSNVSASILGRSSIMAIGFRDQSAERAISVSNSVSDQLSRYYDEISTQRYDVNVSRLTSALGTQAAKVHALDKKMGAVIATNPYVVSDRSIDNITERVATLSIQRAEAHAQMQADTAIASTYASNSQLSKTARHEILASDPTYQALRTATAKDSAALASERAGYTGSFPGLPGAKAKIQSEDATLQTVASRALKDPGAYSPSAAGTYAQRSHANAVIAGDRARVSQLDGLIAAQQQNLRDLPTTGNTFDELRAQRDAAQAEYTALATRRANAVANRAEASSLGSVVVLDRAIKADTQLAGGRSRAAFLSLMVIIALALGAAFLVESLDPRIRRAEEVEELYGIPVVAQFGAKG
jgi:capsular polysaccharide biosynthesis protein